MTAGLQARNGLPPTLLPERRSGRLRGRPRARAITLVENIPAAAPKTR
jgi:hypothetical protein